MQKKYIYLLLFLLVPVAYLLTADKKPPGLKTGDLAPDIVLQNPEGDTLRLYDYLNGPLILIDFWAAWCAPCREEHPQLVRIYKRFSDQSFENAQGFLIFGVSFDRNRDAWVNAIENDGLVWETQVSDLKGWKSAMSELYDVNSIPKKILIGPDGKIIEKDFSVKDLEQILTDRLSK